MTYPKISQEISDPVNENIQKLAALFPSAVKDGELDIDALKQELGQFDEVGPEKYELTWAGKQEAKQTSFKSIIGKTLKYIPEDSKHPETTENLFIEGDNLEALKLLRQNYYGAVKMIYIDPPYNTGNDFVYNDNFKMSKEESDIAEGILSDLGERYTMNRKNQNRYHTNWLNMIYPRLKLAQALLKEDGVIFISIDDNEAYNLKIICDEIFGEINFIGLFIINSSPSAIDYGHIAKTHDYALFYAKNIELTSTSHLEEKEKIFKYSDEIGPFNLYPLYNGNVAFNPKTRPNLYYQFYLNPQKVDENDFFEIDVEKHEDWIEVWPVISKKDGISRVWRWGKPKAKANLNVEIVGHKTEEGNYRIVQKTRLTGKVIRSLQIDKEVSSRKGTAELEKLFGKKIFSFPKPVELIRRFAAISCDKDALILDFFAGTSPTAQAVMQLNTEDNGKRKYIMVQLAELFDESSEAFKAEYQHISELSKERIRRAGEKIIEENKDKEGLENLDIGFKAFRIGNTNINWLHQDLRGGDLFDHYDKNASDKDKLDFTPDFTDMDVVYEIMLRQTDIPLSSKVDQLTDIGERTYIFADSFLVCLEQVISRELVDRLSAIEPLPVKFVFRDSAFDDDIALKDETFRTLSALIERNSGGEKQTYTVEFI